MKKVALYCRVSLSNGSQTTENQKIRLVEYATNNQLDYDIFEETESTRKTRPVKQALLKKLRQNEYDAVIVYKLDRWARSSTELILDTKELVDKSVGFISLSDHLDFSTAAGKLQFQILSAFAEFERELIRERTIEGLRRAKQQGKKGGRPQGSKDSKPRRKSGYILREAKKRQKVDEDAGVHKSIESYIN
ncbi:recombinase family protein [Carboxylicivirga mesophila]|uniref:Recombinase family protein n=1 Tax=Carboxylicivirga mesophila TaxID=1166478 RepID=A0ABS5KCI3_9BACT|nr:recombinase family protein [Carboxylicivirga mesophila]MBS2212228.1 recombinase family protein [Carboxylicivirga mesophila]